MNNNENVWQSVRNNGRVSKNSNTQLIFLKCMPRTSLNELLHRFTSYNGKPPQIVNDINNQRLNDPHTNKQYKLSTHIQMNHKLYNKSLYINYKLNNANVFHVSLHLCPGQTHGKFSLMHFKQQSNVGRTLRLCRRGNSERSFKFCNGHQLNSNLDDEFKNEMKHVVNVFNMYFKPGNTLYIKNPLTVNSVNTHNKLNNMWKNMTNSVNSYTRRQHKH
jgi:hypothetical protein